MTGTTSPEHELDVRRRRARFRAWHRGTQEMDLILGRFADAELGGLSGRDLDAFEHLLEALDAELFEWIARGSPPLPGHDAGLIQRIRAFHGLPA